MTNYSVSEILKGEKKLIQAKETEKNNGVSQRKTSSFCEQSEMENQIKLKFVEV